MAKLELNNDQLRLIQKALDFYSRVGMGQFNEIIEHPTFEKSLHRQFSPNKPFKIGDQTMRGEVVEIDKKGKWIKTKGSWGNGEEIKKWTDLENVMYSPDWSALHAMEDAIKQQLNIARNLLYGEDMGRNGSWGIYNEKVDESCREAFNIIQVIRHEFWKENPNRSNVTVDSSVDSRIKNKVKVELDV
jgi:hypothetical protein